MTKMKNSEVLSNYNKLIEFRSRDIKMRSARLAFTICQNYKALEKAYEPYQEALKDVMSCVGVDITKPETSKAKIDPDTAKKVEELLAIETDVDIKTVKIDEIEAAVSEVSMDDIMLLECMLNID